MVPKVNPIIPYWMHSVTPHLPGTPLLLSLFLLLLCFLLSFILFLLRFGFSCFTLLLLCFGFFLLILLVFFPFFFSLPFLPFPLPDFAEPASFLFCLLDFDLDGLSSWDPSSSPSLSSSSSSWQLRWTHGPMRWAGASQLAGYAASYLGND